METKIEDTQTFVFFDLETTGLPHLENNETKIIELALIAVKRAAFEGGGVPRIQKKLLECFNPGRPISSFASYLSKLDNQNLMSESTFNDKFFEYLSLFIERLDPPVCLLAHNGFSFDFPILRAEIENLSKCLPNTVYCADTLIMFRELEETSNAAAPNKNVKKAKVSYKLIDIHKRLVHKTFDNSHTAEGDCLAMISCFATNPMAFATWCDKNRKVFNDTCKMEIGKKLPGN